MRYQYNHGSNTESKWPGLAGMGGLVRSILIYYCLPWRRFALSRFYAQLIHADALLADAMVFDVGAHVGSRTRVLAALGARCIAIEPQPLFASLITWLFRNNPRITVVTNAVASKAGVAQLHISARHPTVSTLSTDWIDKVQDADGFQHVNWNESTDVSVTTLDALIEEYGTPCFCKIDVEGMELSILQGLSSPVPLIAVEFLPAALDIAHGCITRLNTLGKYAYNLSIGESHRLHLVDWIDGENIHEELNRVAATGHSGDLYARLVNPE